MSVWWWPPIIAGCFTGIILLRLLILWILIR